MTEVADTAQRARALDVRRSFIVQAPAGSGKTELLAQRVLALLAVVERPEEVLAITFTRKAAGEMRDRIIRALDQAAGPRPDGSPDAERWELARAVSTRSEELGWRLEEHPSRLNILTIDAMDRFLAEQLPLLAQGLGGAAVADRPGPLYREAARRVFREGGPGDDDQAAVARLLVHLDNDQRRGIELLAAMLARRDQWLRHLPEDPDAARADLEDGLRSLAAWALSEADRHLSLADRQTLAQIGATAAETRAAKDEGEGEELAVCAGLSAPPTPTPENVDVWRAMASVLFTKSGELRKKFNARAGVPAGCEVYEEANALLARLRETPEAEQALQRLHKLPPITYDEAQWAVLSVLPRCLRLAAAHLALVFTEQGVVDYTAISQAAREALEDERGPTELAMRLDYRIRHILVDEFQDTSLRQTTVLGLLTAGWSPDDGRTLFCVGDPMQSIYGFREAEVGLFLAIRSRGLGDIRLEPLVLSSNFRSRPGVVDWVNRSFEAVLDADDDPVLGKVAFAPGTAVRGQRGEDSQLKPLPQESESGHARVPTEGVHWIALPGAGPDSEAEAVAEQVEAMRRESPDETVAILVRTRTQLSYLLPALRRRGLRYQGSDVQALTDRTVVQDLVNLARAMSDPGDRLAWLALLRSPCCGLELADMETLVQADDPVLWHTLCRADAVAGLSDAGRRRIGTLVERLGPELARRGRVPARDWLEAAWCAIGGPAVLGAREDLDDAGRCLDLVESFDQGGEIRAIDEFEEALESLYAAPDPEAGEGLQIMTIHGAKGLEFDHVFLLLGHSAGRGDSRPLLRHMEMASEGTVALAPLEPFGGDRDPVHRFLTAIEKERQAYERGRLLYVATTRARESLRLVASCGVKPTDAGPEPIPPRAGSLLEPLWWQARPEMESALAAGVAEPEAGEQDEGRRPLRRLPVDWVPPELPGTRLEPATGRSRSIPRVEFSWAGEVARHVGVAVHDILARIAASGPDAWDEEQLQGAFQHAQRRLAAEGLPEDRLEPAMDRVREAVTATLDDANGRWLLAPEHEDAASELALTGMDEGELVSVVLDRTFVADGVRWIVDYKTSEHEGGDLEDFLTREADRYREQLRRYGRLMAGMDDRPRKLALYFPLLGRLVEVDD